MNEVNEGVGIILARMETHPEEFFETHRENSKWRWIFSENLRDVMTEPEKAALHSGMTKVRRLEITHKAIATILPQEEKDPYEKEDYNEFVGKGAQGANPKKTLAMTRSEWEVFKAKNRASN
jgi:hypothetical protein